MCVTKVQQKYKGVRQIERRPLTTKRQATDYPENHIPKKIIKYDGSFSWYRKNENVMFPTHKLIYQ